MVYIVSSRPARTIYLDPNSKSTTKGWIITSIVESMEDLKVEKVL